MFSKIYMQDSHFRVTRNHYKWQQFTPINRRMLNYMIRAMQYNASIKNLIFKTISWHEKCPGYNVQEQKKNRKAAIETVFIMAPNLSLKLWVTVWGINNTEKISIN